MLSKTELLPNVVKELKSIFTGHDVCLISEAVVYDCGNKLVKSAELKESMCNEILMIEELSSAVNNNIVFHVNDIIYYDKDLHNIPFNRRVELLKKLISDQSTFVSLTNFHKASTPKDFMKITNNIRGEKRCNKILFRTYNSKYPVKSKENRSSELATLKNDVHDTITIYLDECLYESDLSICPSNRDECKLINIFKCKHRKDYYM